MIDTEIQFDPKIVERIEHINIYKRKLKWKVPFILIFVMLHEVLRLIDPYSDFNPTRSTLFEIILIVTVFIALAYYVFDKTTDSTEYEKPFVGHLYKIWHTTLDYLMIIPGLVLVVTVLNMFVVSFSPISGTSMAPSYSDEEAVVFTHINDGYERGDVVIVNEQSLVDPYLIKRVIGLPGETITIQDNRVFVNDVLLDEAYIDETKVSTYCVNGSSVCSYTMDVDEYFVLGDNRDGHALTNQPSGYSIDSRTFGPVQYENIFGRVIFQFRDYNILN